MKKLIVPIIVFALALTTTVKAQSDPEYTQVTVDELPGAVRNAVNNNYSNWTIVTAYRVTEITGQTGTRGGVNNSGQTGSSQNNNTMSGKSAGKTSKEKVQTNNRNDNRPDNPTYESQNGTARTTTTQETPEPDNIDTFDNQGSDDTENDYDPFEEDTEDTYDNEGTMETAPAETNDQNQINYEDAGTSRGGNAGEKRVYYELILTGDNETKTVKFDENGNEI